MDIIFTGYIIPLTLAFTMLGMGLSLQKSDFGNIFRHPKPLIIGVVFKLLILPLLAALIAKIFRLSPEFTVGLIIISACPGGSTTNILTYIFRSNVALSISMTTISSLITLVSLPFTTSMALLVFIGRDAEIHLPFGHTIFNVFILTVLPTALGVFIRHQRPRISEYLDKPLRYILPSLLLLVFGGYFIFPHKEDPVHWKEGLIIFSSGLLFNLSGMFSGAEVGKRLKLSLKDRIAIIIEIGLQNTTLAIFIASTLLNNYKMGLMAVIYSGFSFFSTAIFIFVYKKIYFYKKLK